MGFQIDDDIKVSLDFDLAVRLGECILNSSTIDKQIRALGHRLVAMDENKREGRQPEARQWIPRPARASTSPPSGGFEEGL